MKKQKEYIIKAADGIQNNFDQLWKWCESRGLFSDKDFHNYLMWIEHEVSRGTWWIKHNAQELTGD